MKNPKIVVILPALNEEITIQKVISDFRKELPKARIIVIDNGSTDKTVELAKKSGAEVELFKRKGKGRVIREFFHKIDADYYILVDSDDTYPAQKVHDLLKPVMNNEADMTVGSRLGNFKKEKKKLMHKFGNLVILWTLKFCFPNDITDMLSGYRVLNRELVADLNLLSSGFAIETEITIKTLEQGYRIKEIPIEYRERPAGSESKLDSLMDGTYILTTVLELFRDYRPMQFFLFFSIIPFALSIGFLWDVGSSYMKYHALTNLTSVILAIFFGLATMILISMGFIASSVHKAHKETQELLKRIKRKL